MSAGTGEISGGQFLKVAKATTPLPPSASPSKTVKYPFKSFFFCWLKTGRTVRMIDYSLEMVAVVPSNLVKVTVNGSL